MDVLDEVTFQRVDIGDYERVLSIRDGVYDGRDYLPALYQTMMTNYIGYALSHKGKLVAFMCVTFVDGGETMVSRGMRVNEQYEGLGLANLLTNCVLQEHKNNKQLKRKAYLFKNENVKLVEKVQTGKATLTLQRSTLFSTGKKAVMTSLDVQNKSPVKILQKNNLEALFKCKETMKNLFPEERIVVNWIPYRLCESNVDNIFTQNCHIILTETSGENFDIPQLLTVGVGYSTVVGTVYNLWIYGEIKEENFFIHIREHILKCTSFLQESVIFIIHHHDLGSAAFITNTMEGYAKMSKNISGQNITYCAEEVL